MQAAQYSVRPLQIRKRMTNSQGKATTAWELTWIDQNNDLHKEQLDTQAAATGRWTALAALR